MTNVFNASDKARVIKSDKAIVTIARQPAIALGVTIQYGRPVQQVPVLADEDVISIGKPSGTITAETILMKGSGDITENPLINSDGCKVGQTLTIKFIDGACDTQTKPVTCNNCIASAISVTARGGQGYVATGVTITFTSMSFT